MDPLDASTVALAEAGLLVAGGWGAARFTAAAAGRIPRSAGLMAAVAAWLVLFGLLPLAGFAVLAPRVAAHAARPSGLEVVILNIVPFALVASPLIGFVHGLAATRRARPPTR